MKRTCLLLTICILALASALAKGLPEYEISPTGTTGVSGTYNVTVSVLSKSNKLSDEEIKACAVHGVLFRGIPAVTGYSAQKPLAGNASAEAEHSAFYESFFGNGGRAASYGSIIGGQRQVVKTGKMYRTTATVSVNKDQLRKDLENEGVIKSLNSIF